VGDRVNISFKKCGKEFVGARDLCKSIIKDSTRDRCNIDS